MFQYIEKLRQKPDSVKKRVAFTISFSFVGIIFIVWFSIIYPGFREQKNIDDKISANEISPFSTFADIASQSASAIGDQISKIKVVGAGFLGKTEYINLASTTDISSTTNTVVSTSTDIIATTTNSY